jgi:hypothetical protein
MQKLVRRLTITFPWERTRILSQFIMVESRWAIVSVVQPWNSSRIVSWMMDSVLKGKKMFQVEFTLWDLDWGYESRPTHLVSIFAVISSRTRIRFLRRIVRAKHRSWRSPTEKFPPPSTTRCSRARTFLESSTWNQIEVIIHAAP